MPIYHFHLADGGREEDKEGTELPDAQAARIQAVTYAAEILKDQPDELWARGHWRVEVTDDDGALLHTVMMLAIDAPPRAASRSGSDDA